MMRGERSEGTAAASPGRAGSARRRRQADAAWVADRLSARDWQIIETINRLRLVSGKQLERLYFQSLTGHAREVVRGRVLHRLAHWHVLTALPRRIGGAARGSAESLFALSSVGARLCRERQNATNSPSRVRRPELPTERTVRHTLAVTELYVELVEQTRLHGAQLRAFAAEPAAWWPNGIGSHVKPDAYTALELGSIREHWWMEVDLATESLPTIKRKLYVYLDFVRRGQLGPHGVIPRVLVIAYTRERCEALRSVASRLPAPAPELFLVVHQQAAVSTLLGSLNA